jgi:hypothetical protein
MYLIISYDFGNSNDVSINSITNDLEKANKHYKIILDYNKDYNKDDTNCKLIELIYIEDEFFDMKGFTLYWGELHNNAKILLSNNKDDD